MTTISISPADFRDIVDVASIVASVVATMIAVWVVYLMVRPSRRVREERRREREERPGELEEMWRVMDRMESRLEVLERAVAADDPAPRITRPARDARDDRLLSPAGDGRESGGMK